MITTTTYPHTVKTLWGCLTPEGFFQCQKTETGWQALSSNGNTSAIYGEALPHQSAALAVLWQVILQNVAPILRVNPAALPDNSDQLKQIIARLHVGTLTLECFSPYRRQSFVVEEVEDAFNQLHCPQPLFPGAVNTFSYQRLVNEAGQVLSEVGSPTVTEQFRQFTEACAQFQPLEIAVVA